ncbi:LytR/AlgR family response regulator transcription factor [Labilibacter marinus]|uniref:LytR/AlgR family response regulator transcription factor n=1 Tax=Labilibacter marinus TaxID=1477105 RepID=UPI00083033FB|nr:LytTR family DNA-binding domain-containing protein [Labilibacter marinus]
MQAIIIDDEKDAVNGLKKLITDFVDTEVKVVGSANNLDDGIGLILKQKPDLVFLDIEMPQKNGLKIYNTFPNPDFQIIFTTAYSEYAIDAVKRNAADYLLKPVNFMELSEAIKKVRCRIEEKQSKLNLEKHLSAVSPASYVGNNIMFPVSDGFEMENSSNIEYAYAEQAYSVAVMYSGRKITVSKPLKDLELLLPENQFYRTHKSYLINIYYIQKFIKGKQSIVVLRSGEKIPVSVRNVSDFTKDIQKLIS